MFSRGLGWFFIYWSKARAFLSQCKIMSNKHTRGTLPAFFPSIKAKTCEIIKNYKSLDNAITVMGRKDFHHSLTVRFVGVFPQ